jgi:hypothetical protein
MFAMFHGKELFWFAAVILIAFILMRKLRKR